MRPLQKGAILGSLLAEISVGWEKFECKNCEAKGVEHKPFTLIPK